MNFAKECQFCKKRRVGCHSDCETDEKIRERSALIRKNRIAYNAYRDYYHQAQVRMKKRG